MAPQNDRTTPIPIPKAAPEDVRNDELVEIFDTQDEAEAMIIKGLLESEGIPALVSSLDATQMLYPGVGGIIVRVRADQAEEAKRIIDENRSASPADIGGPDAA